MLFSETVRRSPESEKKHIYFYLNKLLFVDSITGVENISGTAIVTFAGPDASNFRSDAHDRRVKRGWNKFSGYFKPFNRGGGWLPFSITPCSKKVWRLKF